MKLVRRTYDDIGRKYHFDNGESYYSVTTMLGATKDMSGLDKWRDAIGHEEADRQTKRAGRIGDELHQNGEDWLNGITPSYSNPFNKKLFRKIESLLSFYHRNTHWTENFLVSQKLGLAGTADALVDWYDGPTDGARLTVLDFKTCKQEPNPAYIEDYKLQLACYAYMIYEMTGEMPLHGVLLFAPKFHPAGLAMPVDIKAYFPAVEKRIQKFRIMLDNRNQ